MLERFLSEVDLGVLIRLNLFQNVLVLILSVEIEASHNLFEQIYVDDLVTLAPGKTECFVEEDLKCFFLVLENLGGLEMLLRHVGLRDVGGLVAGDEIEVEHELVVLVICSQGCVGRRRWLVLGFYLYILILKLQINVVLIDVDGAVS